jgi:hypothetical protein
VDQFAHPGAEQAGHGGQTDGEGEVCVQPDKR